MVTYYVVQSYSISRKGQTIADPPVQAQNADHARRMAERLSHSKAGVVAFSRTGDPQTGDFDDAVVIAVFGQALAEVEMAEAAA